MKSPASRSLTLLVAASLVYGCAASEVARAPAASDSLPAPNDGESVSPPAVSAPSPAHEAVERSLPSETQAPSPSEGRDLLAKYPRIQLHAVSEQRRFLPDDREDLLRELATLTPLEHRCVEELVQSHWRMTRRVELAGDSAPRFTNCNVGGGLAFVAAEVAAMKQSAYGGEPAKARAAASRVLFAIQSFYANTTYIEYTHDGRAYASLEKVPGLALWRATDREAVEKLSVNGDITSGIDPAATSDIDRSMCAAGATPQASLSKIRPDIGAGALPLPGWGGMSRYDAARRMALQASAEFLHQTRDVHPNVFVGCSRTLSFFASLFGGDQ
jgi:hypothetical protein